MRTLPCTYLQPLGVSSQDTGKVQLLHLLLQPARQTRVHARSTGQNNVFVELRSGIDSRLLDCLEEQFYCRSIVKGTTWNEPSSSSFHVQNRI